MCYFLFLVEIIAFATSFFDRMFTADEIVVVVAFNDGNPVSGAGDSSSAGSRGSGANTNSNFTSSFSRRVLAFTVHSGTIRTTTLVSGTTS